MSDFELLADYHGASLKLSFAREPRAALRINGVLRDESDANDDTTTLRLTSVVQTDYEYHEFIEGIVSYGPEEIDARIIASEQVLMSQTFSRA